MRIDRVVMVLAGAMVLLSVGDSAPRRLPSPGSTGGARLREIHAAPVAQVLSSFAKH
jgi:hypothetical protein